MNTGILDALVKKHSASCTFYNNIKPYLHKLSPKECEVMICLYIDRLSIADTATKLKIKPDTVSTHKHNAINKIRKAMGEH